MRVPGAELNCKKLSQVKSGPVSLIKSKTDSRIESEMVTSAKLTMPMTELVLDNLCVNGWNIDVVAECSWQS